MARPPKLPIPERALNDVGAILGRTGAGKSGTGRIRLTVGDIILLAGIFTIIAVVRDAAESD